MSNRTLTATGRKLTLVVLGLAALITTMLCAFALPSLHSGPHRVPIGVTGSEGTTKALRQNVDAATWDVRSYPTAAALHDAVEDRDIAGGLDVSPHRVDVYTATAGSPMATSALTALGENVAARQSVRATVHDLVPFTRDDPRGAGMTAALLPMIFGGIFPALILGNVFPGHRGLRTRIAGAVLFSLAAGAAIAAVLQFATHSVDGNYWLTAGWATLGQLLPPGASGSLLRANAFFDSSGAGLPTLTLTVWVGIGVALALLADRRGRRPATDRPEAAATA
ncbi:hypothetical protein ACFWBC_05670 [Streptomyces sp. NPDC059985]|uniref:hypothetical protein n=1 Tax=Streptomyces sp. NPDC059985 TaxID=3347025 RepID=UPI003680E564